MGKIKRYFKFTFLFIVIILIISLVSAGGFKDFYSKITGKATTQTTTLNITVTSGSAPVIIAVYNETMGHSPTEGPALTYVTTVFRVNDPDGIANLNNGTATINFSKAGESTRQATCTFVVGQSTSTQANYTCNITMWWYDGPGVWGISVYIADWNGNTGYNSTIKNFSVGTTDGLIANRSTLTWPPISPGASNIDANDFIGLNNTGNRPRSLEVNATDLRGDSNAAYALGANNFSVKNAAGCEGSAMLNRTYVNITSVTVFDRGNFTWNNGTGQANLHFCLETSNSNLIAQSYSTAPAGSGAWIIRTA